jgi:acyl carrier protein
MEVSPQVAIQNWLVSQLAEQLSLDAATIKVSEPLTRYGLDSIDAVTMVGDLEDWLELELPSTLFWDYPTIEKSAQYLSENYDVTEVLANADLNEVQETRKEQAKPADNGKGLGGLWGRLTGT